MEGLGTMWLNIDKPTKKATFHEDCCTYIPTADSEFKKLNGVGQQGGWLQFQTLEKGWMFFQDNFPEYEHNHCHFCKNMKSRPR